MGSKKTGRRQIVPLPVALPENTPVTDPNAPRVDQPAPPWFRGSRPRRTQSLVGHRRKSRAR